jgi:hypothetical protein
MTEEEPRYTEAEWKQKMVDEHLVSSFHRAGTGFRIRSTDVFREILVKTLFPITEVSIHEEVKEVLKELSGPNTATISEEKLE